MAVEFIGVSWLKFQSKLERFAAFRSTWSRRAKTWMEISIHRRRFPIIFDWLATEIINEDVDWWCPLEIQIEVVEVTSNGRQLSEFDNFDGDALRRRQEGEADEGVAFFMWRRGAEVTRQRDPRARGEGVADVAEIDAHPPHFAGSHQLVAVVDLNHQFGLLF